MRHITSIARRRSAAFTLVEVMVALVVLSIGLLGIASMQALALSSTNNARMRSLAAIEAASLASMMHTNRAYWATSAPASFTVVDGTISDSVLKTAGVDCTSTTTPCTPARLAAYDTQKWVAALGAVIPHPTVNVTCPVAVVPMNCTIYITWAESAVALTKQEADNAAADAAFKKPDYTLYVQP
jgi:type IV pilus assembly protein PilV